jgi:hypothetical protein
VRRGRRSTRRRAGPSGRPGPARPPHRYRTLRRRPLRSRRPRRRRRRPPRTQGNVIQGISRSLKEEVTTDEHLVTSLDWSTYHILTFPEVPDEIQVELINRPDAPAWGAGEISICPMGAAIGNAIFDATGVRLRTLPYTPARVLAALKGA